MIVGIERNRYSDDCYYPQYHLSLSSLEAQYPGRDIHMHFGGRVLVNWLMMAEPGSLVLANVMRNIVHTIALEYQRKSVLHTYKRHFPAWMQVMCITGPRQLYVSALDTVLRNNGSEDGLIGVKGGNDFRAYGGTFKIYDDSVPRESHYMFFMAKENLSLLRDYMNRTYERTVVTANHHDYYFIYKHHRIAFDGAETLASIGIAKEDAHVLSFASVDTIPLNNSRYLTVREAAWVQQVLATPLFLEV